MNEIMEKQLDNWKKVLLGYVGATVTLILIALIELPTQIINTHETRFVSIDGWLGPWFILEIASLVPGLILLLSWRQMPLAQRMPTGFGFLAVAWLNLLAFNLHLATYLAKTFSIFVFVTGAMLAVLYLLLRRSQPRKEEIFP